MFYVKSLSGEEAVYCSCQMIALENNEYNDESWSNTKFKYSIKVCAKFTEVNYQT